MLTASTSNWKVSRIWTPHGGGCHRSRPNIQARKWRYGTATRATSLPKLTDTNSFTSHFSAAQLRIAAQLDVLNTACGRFLRIPEFSDSPARFISSIRRIESFDELAVEFYGDGLLPIVKSELLLRGVVHAQD